MVGSQLAVPWCRWLAEPGGWGQWSGLCHRTLVGGLLMLPGMWGQHPYLLSGPSAVAEGSPYYPIGFLYFFPSFFFFFIWLSVCYFDWVIVCYFFFNILKILLLWENSTWEHSFYTLQSIRVIMSPREYYCFQAKFCVSDRFDCKKQVLWILVIFLSSLFSVRWNQN